MRNAETNKKIQRSKSESICYQIVLNSFGPSVHDNIQFFVARNSIPVSRKLLVLDYFKFLSRIFQNIKNIMYAWFSSIQHEWSIVN